MTLFGGLVVAAAAMGFLASLVKLTESLSIVINYAVLISGIVILYLGVLLSRLKQAKTDP
jgi:hypothetical protein